MSRFTGRDEKKKASGYIHTGLYSSLVNNMVKTYCHLLSYLFTMGILVSPIHLYAQGGHTNSYKLTVKQLPRKVHDFLSVRQVC